MESKHVAMHMSPLIRSVPLCWWNTPALGSNIVHLCCTNFPMTNWTKSTVGSISQNSYRSSPQSRGRNFYLKTTKYGFRVTPSSLIGPISLESRILYIIGNSKLIQGSGICGLQLFCSVVRPSGAEISPTLIHLYYILNAMSATWRITLAITRSCPCGVSSK